MDLFEKKIKIADDCIVQDMGTGIVILNLKTERFYELEAIGKHFWQAITELQDYKLAFNSLLQEYEVSEELLQLDMNQLIEDLRKAELIELV